MARKNVSVQRVDTEVDIKLSIWDSDVGKVCEEGVSKAQFTVLKAKLKPLVSHNALNAASEAFQSKIKP